MSVFQLRDWWGLQLSNSSSDSANEEFDLGAMAIGNVDNCEPPADKIVVGSQSGTMRIFYPTRENYRVEDLMVEENFGVPILQVLLGMFLPGSNLLGIAILFPRRLSVFEVIPQGLFDQNMILDVFAQFLRHRWSRWTNKLLCTSKTLFS